MFCDFIIRSLNNFIPCVHAAMLSLVFDGCCAALVAALILAAPSHVHSDSVCLLAPGLPWNFGPYQKQQYLLSLGLSDAGHDIKWMATSVHQQMPEGVYRTTAKYVAALKKRMPPKSFGRLDHLTYLGGGTPEKITGNPPMISISRLNRQAAMYKCDVLLTLMDTNALLRDAPFAVPAIAWIPYHFEELHAGDMFLLRGFSGVASLAPTMANSIRAQLEPSNPLVPKPVVQFVPHMLAGAATDGTVDGRRPRTRAKLGLKDDTFVVLMQGGNYESYDRKGWYAAIQAFASFYFKTVEESGSAPDVYLYIHAISSLTIAENEKAGTAPANAPREGVQLLQYLRDANVPPSVYTLDGKMYPWEFVYPAFGPQGNPFPSISFGPQGNPFPSISFLVG